MASAISNTNSIHIGNHSEWIITLTCSCMNKVPLSCSPLLPAPEVVSDSIVVVIDCIMSHPFDIFGTIVLPLQNIKPSRYLNAYVWCIPKRKINRNLEYLKKMYTLSLLHLSSKSTDHFRIHCRIVGYLHFLLH